MQDKDECVLGSSSALEKSTVDDITKQIWHGIAGDEALCPDKLRAEGYAAFPD